MTEHTPGPWRYSRTMRLVGNGIAAPWVCQVEDQGVSRERFEANSRLIAAAPEMLSALEPFSEIAGEGSEDFPDETPVVVKFGRTTHYALKLGDLRRAQAAVNKAEGT